MRLVLIAIAYCLGAAVNASAAEIKSISRLAAGPENVLFVADWKTARVHAVNLPASAQKPAGTAFNILDLENLLSRQVGGAKITVEDMVVRPGTAEVYVAVSYGAAKTPALFLVTSDRQGSPRRPQGGEVDLDQRFATRPRRLQILEGNARAKLYSDRHEMARGELFIAGLSNQEFSSTLRRIKYPFDSQQSITSVEIYHTGHNLIETRAPIRAMSFATLGGSPTLSPPIRARPS